MRRSKNSLGSLLASPALAAAAVAANIPRATLLAIAVTLDHFSRKARRLLRIDELDHDMVAGLLQIPAETVRSCIDALTGKKLIDTHGHLRLGGEKASSTYRVRAYRARQRQKGLLPPSKRAAARLQKLQMQQYPDADDAGEIAARRARLSQQDPSNLSAKGKKP